MKNQRVVRHVFLDGDVLDVTRQKRYAEPLPAVSSTETSPIPQTPIPDTPLIKVETGSTANVTYSTDNASNSTTPPASTTIVTTVKPEAGKTGQNITTASTPPSVTRVPVSGENITFFFLLRL